MTGLTVRIASRRTPSDLNDHDTVEDVELRARHAQLAQTALEPGSDPDLRQPRFGTLGRNAR
jgi:hypothetical protein